MKKVLRRILVGLAAVVIVAIVAFVIWAENPMRAEAAPLSGIDYVDEPDGVVLTPADPNGTGLVFIAGARVEPQAYAAKLEPLAEAGITVVIARPILNFAIFEVRPLSTFEALAPDVTDWYVGGHSLGGVKACQYAADTAGLILFGSYCANEITDLPVLSISASNDGLSTPTKIADAAHYLPADADFVELAGGNHAQFGDYGVQPGDGTSTITDQKFTEQLTAAVLEFVG